MGPGREEGKGCRGLVSHCSAVDTGREVPQGHCVCRPFTLNTLILAHGVLPHPHRQLSQVPRPRGQAQELATQWGVCCRDGCRGSLCTPLWGLCVEESGEQRCTRKTFMADVTGDLGLKMSRFPLEPHPRWGLCAQTQDTQKEEAVRAPFPAPRP